MAAVQRGEAAQEHLDRVRTLLDSTAEAIATVLSEDDSGIGIVMQNHAGAGTALDALHIARRVEPRPPAELANLLTLDALIRTYGMEAVELEDLMLQLRCL